MTKPNGPQDQICTLPVLQSDDVVDVGIVRPTEIGGERMVAFQIPRLGIGFAMGLADCATAANALAIAAQKVMDMNNEDAEKTGSAIIVARH